MEITAMLYLCTSRKWI